MRIERLPVSAASHQEELPRFSVGLFASVIPTEGESPTSNTPTKKNSSQARPAAGV